MDHQEEASDYDMQCTKPITLFQVGTTFYENGLEVPCGKCLACRIKKRSEWTMRLIQELSYHDDAVFVTLTYSDDHLPENESLVKSDLQKFIKRLRKNLDKPIKYFACGEYGDKTERPHYHLIIYGLGLKPQDKQLIIDAWQYADWNVDTIRRKSFGLVEPKSIAYVAQYIDKKFTGDKAKEEYTDKQREPVFRLLSLGIGKRYCMENAEQIKKDLAINYKGNQVSLPRYYVKLLDIDPDLLKQKAVEQDCEKVQRITGVYIDRESLYLKGSVNDNVVLIKTTQNGKAQHDKNLHAKVKLKERSL